MRGTAQPVQYIILFTLSASFYAGCGHFFIYMSAAIKRFLNILSANHLIMFALVYKRGKRRKYCSLWVHPKRQKRQQYLQYWRLAGEIQLHGTQFEEYLPSQLDGIGSAYAHWFSKYRHGSDCHRIDTSLFPVPTT